MGELAEEARDIATTVGYATPRSARRLEILAGLIDELERRAEVAERESDAMLTAASKLVQIDARVVAIVRVREVADRLDDQSGWHTQLDLLGCAPGTLRTGDPIMIPVPGNDAPDVTLLERRGTELIEAGERLLHEYEMRKSEKPCTTMSTASDVLHSEPVRP